jgi:ribose/xylose/arabinose/galactoside ABC-type transport system permease subunit
MSDFWSFVIVGCLAAISGFVLAVVFRRGRSGRS